jgi:hypothetical protein
LPAPPALVPEHARVPPHPVPTPKASPGRPVAPVSPACAAKPLAAACLLSARHLCPGFCARSLHVPGSVWRCLGLPVAVGPHWPGAFPAVPFCRLPGGSLRPAVPLHLPQKRAHGAAACASPAASLVVLAALCACSAPFPARAPLLCRWLLWLQCSAQGRLPAFSCRYGFGVLQPLHPCWLFCCVVLTATPSVPPALHELRAVSRGVGAACVWVLHLGGCGVCAGATARGGWMPPLLWFASVGPVAVLGPRASACPLVPPRCRGAPASAPLLAVLLSILLLRRAPSRAVCLGATVRGGCGVCAGATARGDGISPLLRFASVGPVPD